MKVALFCAGDKNIVFPAVVALSSIMDKNKGVFDAFISFPQQDLTEDMENMFALYEIKYISPYDLDNKETISDFPLMKELTWPREIFLNWIFPNYLSSLGYDYSIKVDYDILCLDTYNLDEIIPRQHVMSGLYCETELTNQSVSMAFSEYLTINKRYDKDIDSYLNIGFVCINNKVYTELDFFTKLKNTYIELLTACPNVDLAEQVAVSIILSVNGGVMKIPSSYNQRIRWGAFVKPDLKPSIKNIHYITSMKPWLPLKRGLVKDFTRRKQGMIFMYRTIWLHYAARNPWFSIFCKERKLEPIEELGIATIVCHWYNDRIKELENDNRRLSGK